MIKELIDQFYSDKQREKEQQHFYITDAGRCGRAIFFKFKKAPREEMEARVLRMFEHGDYIHQLIMRSLVALREVRVITAEVDIGPQAIISGRADAILSDGKNLYVLDIKSINSMVFKNLDQPKEENINQIQLYLHFFKIPKGILLYVNKDTQALKEFSLDYDRQRAETLLAELTNLKTKIDSDVVPDRIPGWPDDWQCQYCQFKEICKMAGENELSWNKFKTKINSR